jgi:hypothetical protein
MRIKLDFVTNSSSSSFIVWGVSIDKNNLQNYDILTDKIYNEYLLRLRAGEDEILTKQEFFEQDDIYEVFKYLNIVLLKYGLSYAAPYDYEVIYIGIDPFEIEDHETGLEFKERVEKALKAVGIKEKPRRIEEAWQDG